MTRSHETPPDTFTLKAAAERVGVSVSTIRRRKARLLAAGAEVDPTGWTIPLSALEAVLVLSPATPNATHSDTDLVEQLRSENTFLRQQVEQQARTIERQAEAHAVISAQLTQLEQRKASERPTSRRRWWQRIDLTNT